MELGLSNKVVLVTGASKGLGAAIALAFGKEQSKLVLVARTQEKTSALKKLKLIF